MVLDCHTHRQPPYPEGIVSLRLPDSILVPDQLYSAGIHPWDTLEGIDEAAYSRLEELAVLPQVVAIGECGIDPLRGAPMFRQLQWFRRQVALSENIGKPLVIHAVKSADVILGLKRDLCPSQPWIIHGFRGKAALSVQLVSKGIYLSFGEKFNPDSVRGVPKDMILAETDESTLPIENIIALIGEAAGEDLTEVVAANTARVFSL